VAFENSILDKLWKAWTERGGEDDLTAWCLGWEYGQRGRRDNEIEGYCPKPGGVREVVGKIGEYLKEKYAGRRGGGGGGMGGGV